MMWAIEIEKNIESEIAMIESELMYAPMMVNKQNFSELCRLLQYSVGSILEHTVICTFVSLLLAHREILRGAFST